MEITVTRYHDLFPVTAYVSEGALEAREVCGNGAVVYGKIFES